MYLQTINPFVRFARIKEHTILQGVLQAADHRIFYCHSGQGQYEANGILRPFTAGTLIYLPAGTPYRYLFEQEIPVFSGCNFDFFQDHTELNAPFPPVEHTGFHAEDILEKQVFEEKDIFSHPIHLENVFQFEEKFTEIAEEFVNHNLYYDVRCSTLLKDVLIQTARLAASSIQGINRKKADDILQYIHSNYHCQLTNKEIAEHFNYHENYISTLILKYTGLTLHQYVLHHKMHMAVVFLQSTTMSIGEVAEKIGMPDIKHFSKCFKKIIGHSPSQFKIK
ncbi:MAG: helix-turn-helix domain-containing protein [Lachnospiraceae bacterium]|nr:helix-turn-helix domain-containing protein [Lachnospiraceae bacterium]